MAQKQKSDKEIVLSSGAAPAPRRKTGAPRVKATSRAKIEQSARPEKTSKSEMSAIPENVLPAQPALRTSEPVFQEIAVLAYSYWEARGCQGGSAEEDWLRAEDELRARLGAAAR